MVDALHCGYIGNSRCEGGMRRVRESYGESYGGVGEEYRKGCGVAVGCFGAEEVLEWMAIVRWQNFYF